MSAGAVRGDHVTSRFRAWLALLALSLQRLARSRQMVWMAVGLLIISVAIVGLNTAAGRWSMRNWHFYGRRGPTHEEWLLQSRVLVTSLPSMDPAQGITAAIWAANQAILEVSDFLVFGRGFVLMMFVSFMLPLWSLCFAVDAVGSEREGRTLIWLMTRPIPRWSIYLAKFVALLPWTLGFNLAGFAIICAFGGEQGALALRLFWPAVLWGSLAFTALFLLIGAFFPKPAIVALTYAFALEVIVAGLPGTIKRLSVGFHVRCMMFERAEPYGLGAENAAIYAPISGGSARWVMIVLTVGLLLIGMALFSRKQHEGAD